MRRPSSTWLRPGWPWHQETSCLTDHLRVHQAMEDAHDKNLQGRRRDAERREPSLPRLLSTLALRRHDADSGVGPSGSGGEACGGGGRGGRCPGRALRKELVVLVARGAAARRHQAWPVAAGLGPYVCEKRSVELLVDSSAEHHDGGGQAGRRWLFEKWYTVGRRRQRWWRRGDFGGVRGVCGAVFSMSVLQGPRPGLGGRRRATPAQIMKSLANFDNGS